MTVTQEEILNLRALNLTPKQIARKLGVKVSEVSSVIQNQAQQTKLDRLAKGELDPVYQCLASE
ncbi:MAG: DNA-binding response regulator, partial [Cyanobacteria bacterium P01_C01_bin.38]